MEITQELFEKIEAYIEGSLSEAELRSFKTLIETNPELKKEIMIHKELQNELSNTKAIEFRKKLVVVSKELTDQNNIQRKKSSILSYWRIAASLIIIIGLSTFLWLQNNPEQDLYAMYYTPYPIGDIKRGSDTTNDTVFKDILLNYKNQEYQKTIAGLESLIVERPNEEKLKLCLGNSYLNTDQLIKAETLFKVVSKESETYFDAQWFLSLTYLKMNQEERMVPILKKLVSQNTRYKKNASALLKKIKDK
ncbi:hypothetical protein [Aquimarina sp. 2201CG14-23]|uniref:hypothetical protein n=1 Tax=Aquimarina mycalae TaxID=3040073 RepID=UPI002477D862|nr:hypothetical protein [Aquimarina sp. 2201CG14-23]MDH7447666.1 hypothetical protein [Aquimarina sp. 2201CG14-23]